MQYLFVGLPLQPVPLLPVDARPSSNLNQLMLCLSLLHNRLRSELGRSSDSWFLLLVSDAPDARYERRRRGGLRSRAQDLQDAQDWKSQQSVVPLCCPWLLPHVASLVMSLESSRYAGSFCEFHSLRASRSRSILDNAVTSPAITGDER